MVPVPDERKRDGGWLLVGAQQYGPGHEDQRSGKAYPGESFHAHDPSGWRTTAFGPRLMSALCVNLQ